LITRDTGDWRPLVFLAVLTSHVVIVLLVIREARLVIFSPNDSYEPLVLMLLHDKARAPTDTVTPRRSAVSPPAAVPKNRTVIPKPGPDNSITVPPETPPQPRIDWEREAELAAQNGVANAEKQKNYRDLSALSPAQLSWVKKNHMAPMPPGIEWRHPRFEFDRNSGLPMLWINDHCVLVTLIVFCGIGKIEANGDLFKHLRDPHD
jgi:hypothetical protein